MKLVKRLSLWAGAAGLIPVPFVDLAAIGGIQIEMLRRLSQLYDVPFSENRGKALIAGFAGTMIPASSGIGAASLIKGVPLPACAISAVAMPALSAGATYAIGMAFVQHFRSGGTLLDFEPPDYRDFVKAQAKTLQIVSRVALTEQLSVRDLLPVADFRRFFRVPPPQRRERRHAKFRQRILPAEAVPARGAHFAVAPLRHDVVIPQQDAVERLRGGGQFLRRLGGDDLFDHRIDRRILDADDVFRARLIGRLRAPEIALFVARQQRFAQT